MVSQWAALLTAPQAGKGWWVNEVRLKEKMGIGLPRLPGELE